MEQTPQQQALSQQQIQLDITIMQIKMNLLALAKDMIKDNVITDIDVKELYLDLREEVLGIHNLKNQKENGTNS